MKQKKICPFDGKPCPHQAGCEAVDFDANGHEEVRYRCNRFPVED